MLDPYVPVYKIGSGEIDWIEALERMARKGKPVFLATGASTIGEVQRAVHAILAINPQLVLMQCNTNYTASPENFDHIHLNVLKTYATMFPDVILGLSDHTHGHATGAGRGDAGGAGDREPLHRQQRPGRPGPQICHEPRRPGRRWSTKPACWSAPWARRISSSPAMRARRRSSSAAACARRAISRPARLFTREMIDVLRPATPGAIMPYEIEAVIGTRAAARYALRAKSCAGRTWESERYCQ